MRRSLSRTRAGVFVRLLVVAAVLGPPTALVAAAEATAAVTGITSTGSIAFIRDHNVWLTSPDGLTRRPLTTDGSAATPYETPTQSDDGTVIVAVQHRGQAGAVVSYVHEMNRQGSLLRPPFTPDQYTTETGLGGCFGIRLEATGVVARVSPDASRIVIDKLARNYVGDTTCHGRTRSEVYVINLDGSPASASIRPQDPSTAGLYMISPSWVSSSRLLMTNVFADGTVDIYYYDLGAPTAARWISTPGPDGGSARQWPTLAGTTLATTGYGDSFKAGLRLWTTNGAIPAAPTARCDIDDPDYQGYESYHYFTTPTVAPDGAAVAWAEVQLDANLNPTNSLYVSPVGDIAAGCGSVNRQLLVAGGSDPDWGPAEVGPATAIPAVPGGGGGGGGGGAVIADDVAPKLSELSVSTLRAGRTTTVRYTLSEPAAVTLTLQRRSRRGSRTRYVAVRGGLRHDSEAGRNSVRFSGRFGGRRIAAGSYRLMAVARDAAGNTSRAARTSLRVRR